MEAQHAGCARSSIGLSKKACSVLAGCGNGAETVEEFHQFRTVVCPALRADPAPERRVFRAGNANGHIARGHRRGALNRPVENTAQLDGSVVALAQQSQRLSPREGTDLV